MLKFNPETPHQWPSYDSNEQDVIFVAHPINRKYTYRYVFNGFWGNASQYPFKHIQPRFLENFKSYGVEVA